MTSAYTLLQTLLVDEADGTRRVIVDSFNIALFLEKTFSTARLSLFSPAGNASPLDVEAGKSTARFLEHWVNTSLAAELRPCTIAAVSSEGRVGALKFPALSLQPH